MKKILTLAVMIALTAACSLQAQNKFKGIVKYKLTSTGTTTMEIPAENSTVELKIYEDQLKLGSSVQNGYTVTQNADYSQHISALKSMYDIELETYQGDGKFLIKNKHSKSEADSLSIKDEAPGHFYFEYRDETQPMLGFTAKKAVLHYYDEDSGEDQPTEFWYTDEIGPEYNFLFNGIKGVPLQFEQKLDEGRAITYTATEVVKGKVKDVDMLLPAGFKEASEEEYSNFMKELKDAIELIEE